MPRMLMLGEHDTVLQTGSGSEYVQGTSDRELLGVLDHALRRQEPQPEPGGQRGNPRPQPALARVVVIADNRLVRDALDAALAVAADLEVVFIGEDVEDLSPAIAQGCMADVVLIDLATPTAATMARVRQLTASSPHLGVIVVDTVRTGADLVELLEAGVAGLLLRCATVDQIVQTTRAVVDGATVIPRSLTASLLEAGPNRSRAAEIADLPLTRREHQVIAHVADGLSNKEIAGALNIATFTVKSHVHNVLQKLGLRTRAQLARAYLVACTEARPGRSPAVDRATVSSTVVSFAPEQARGAMPRGNGRA